MVKGTRIARWLRTIGWRLGLCALEDVGPVHRSGAAQRRVAGKAYQRLENDSEARRLVERARDSRPRITAGELSERAKLRLELIEGGRQ